MKADAQFAHWQQIREGLMHTIDKFDEDELAFRPFPGSHSAAEIILHIANAEDGWLHYVVTKELDAWPAQYTPENFPDRPAMKKALTEVHGRTEAYLAALSSASLEATVTAPWGAAFSLSWIVWHVLEHEIHHRGELSLILGLLGKEGLDV